MVSNYKVSFIAADAPKAVGALILSGARPPVVKIHNNVSHVQLLHEKLGDDTVIILRMTAYEGIVVQDQAPEARAVQWCEAMKPVFAAVPYAYIEAGPPLMPVDDWSGQFWVACMDWAHTRGYKLTVMTIGEGQPELPSSGQDGMAPMWPTINMAAAYGYILGPQAYWVDGNMDMNDDWHMFRIYRAFRDYPGKWPTGTRIVFTECFIDLRNGLGWRTALGGDWPRAREGMKALSNEINRRPCPPGVSVIGATNFAIHDVDNTIWQDFNYREHLHEQLADIKAEQDGIIEVPPPVPQPEPPPMSDPVGARWITVQSPYGCNMRASSTMNSEYLGFVAQWSKLRVKTPAVNEYLQTDQGFWIWERNVA